MYQQTANSYKSRSANLYHLPVNTSTQSRRGVGYSGLCWDTAELPAATSLARAPEAIVSLGVQAGDLLLLGQQHSPGCGLWLASDTQGNIRLFESDDTEPNGHSPYRLLGKIVGAIPGAKGLRYVRNVKALRLSKAKASA